MEHSLGLVPTHLDQSSSMDVLEKGNWVRPDGFWSGVPLCMGTHMLGVRSRCSWEWSSFVELQPGFSVNGFLWAKDACVYLSWIHMVGNGEQKVANIPWDHDAHGNKRLLQVTSTAQLGDRKAIGQSPGTCSWQWPRHGAGVGVWCGLALAPCPSCHSRGASAPDSAG